MDDTAGIFVAEAAKFAVSAARVERKDCLQMWRLFFGGGKLFGAKTGNSDHAHVAVTPGLHGNPLDQVIAIPLARTAALRLADPTRRTDHMDIASRHEELGIAGLHRPHPHR